MLKSAFCPILYLLRFKRASCPHDLSRSEGEVGNRVAESEVSDEAQRHHPHILSLQVELFAVVRGPKG